MHHTKLWRDYHITKVAINTVLNLSYYASIMLNALRGLLCSKLCWHNGPVHMLSTSAIWRRYFYTESKSASSVAGLAM